MQPTITHPGRAQSPTTFADNMRLPVHRWFRYSAGFSAELVLSILAEVDEATVLDPFAGSATTLLAAQSGGAESIGIDPHPFVSRVAEAKLERGGRKAYHSMIVAYFLDLAQVWRRLRRVVAGGGEVCLGRGLGAVRRARPGACAVAPLRAAKLHTHG